MKKQLLLIISVIFLAGCGQPDEDFLDENELIDTPTATQENVEIIDDQEDSEELLDDVSILQQTHEVDKKLKEGDVTWIGIKVAPRDELFASGYEFWRFDNEGEERVLVDYFPLVACSSVEWDQNESGGINLRHTQTPCVDFAEYTDIAYNAQGEEKLRVMQDTSKPYQFSFEPNNQGEFEVNLVTEGVCEGQVYDLEDSTDLPKVTLKGVKLASISPNPWEEVFELPEVQVVQCGQYDDSIINPDMDIVEYSEGKIGFTLPDQKGASILLNTDNGLEVVF